MPLESFTFFIDRSLGAKRLAGALRDRGLNVIIHDERFEPDTPDAAWLEVAGREGWVVLTKDKRIRYRPLERKALQKASVRCFVFTQGSQNIDTVIGAFVAAE